MPEYLAPGVYVEEVSFRSKSIEGVSTSTCAFVGTTRKGPLSGAPEVITSAGEFERMYGGLKNLSFTSAGDSNPQTVNYLAHAVRAFFDNGGKRLYLGRTFIPRTTGGVVTSTGIASTTFYNESGNRAGFSARVPGSGLNGVINLFEKRTPATIVTMNSAPLGSLLAVGGSGSVAQPASIEGGVPTFRLRDGDELGITLDSGSSSITFNGAGAEVTGDAVSSPVTIPADTTLTVFINGQSQDIDLTDGSRELSDIVDEINIAIRHGYARLQGGDQIVIGSDRSGTTAQVIVSTLAELGFASDTTANGSGNVADLDAVTVAEIDGLLQAGSIAVRASLPPSTAVLTLITTASGASASIQIQDNAARLAMSLPATEEGGADGATLLYYEKRGASWVGGADGGTTLDSGAVTNAEIVTVNLEAVDADNSKVIYDDLGLGVNHPRFIGTKLAESPTNRADALNNPYYLSTSGSVTIFNLHSGLFAGLTENSLTLSGGDDGAEPGVSSTVAGAVAYEDALQLLEEIDDISIVAAPGHSALAPATPGVYRGVQQALISHAERMRYRVAVLDTPQNQTIAGARAVRSRVDSTYAALYYPWVMINNPSARIGNDQIPAELALPPCGFMCGIYARTDVNRGVWKAPANVIVRGALRFEREITHGQQEVLNPEGVNCLRFFFGRGNRVWGARTVSSDPEWKYINVRRYFIYLEHSIDRSTQWAVFEPNGQRLWSNIRDTITAFLYNEWRSGALLGGAPEEAYFVRCDRSTMTQNDLDNGRLICEIGVAPLKPAEFVIFRIGQMTADVRV